MTSKENMLRKNKYIVLQEAEHEINQLKTHYRCYHNFSIKIDVNNLINESCIKFLSLSKVKQDEKNNSNYF